MYRWKHTVGTVAYMVSVLPFRKFSRTASDIHRKLLLQIMFLMFVVIKFYKCLLFFFVAQLFSAFLHCKTFSNFSKKVFAPSS